MTSAFGAGALFDDRRTFCRIPTDRPAYISTTAALVAGVLYDYQRTFAGVLLFDD